MRLVSFNVMNRRKETRDLQRARMESVASFLQSLQPDVVALQEVTPEAWELLRNGLKLRRWEFCPREDGINKGEGVPVGILSSRWRILDQRSFWLSPTPEVPSRLRGAAHPRVCSTIRVDDGRSVWRVLNVHLDHRNARVRAQSLNVLRQQQRMLPASSEQEARVLCGDFNMPGYRKKLRQFRGEAPGWEDATHMNPVGALRPTYLGWGPFQLARARIDLCLHSPEVSVSAYHAVDPEWEGALLSDHRALVVDLEAPEI